MWKWRISNIANTNFGIIWDDLPGDFSRLASLIQVVMRDKEFSTRGECPEIGTKFE